LDGYVAGPNDGPGCGLGDGGERLHYWVFGRSWRYDAPERGEPTGEDKAWLESALGSTGAVITGRGTYEAAGHWGDKNPWGVPAFVVTHRLGEQPAGGEFIFVDGVSEAIERARAAAGEKSGRPWPPGWSMSSRRSSHRWCSAAGSVSSRDSQIRWSSSISESVNRPSPRSSTTE
jgi:dihydrofolate reductase